MLRKVASGVAWVGRTASMVFGLALVLALVFGAISAAVAHTGSAGLFHLGHNNPTTALSTLTGNVNGAAMRVVNNNADANDTALELRVQSGETPMTVNSATKVANLNADQVDGKDPGEFANASHTHAGGDITSGLVAEGHIDGSIARDTEILQRVVQQDGSGSTLDADLLDGKDQSAFLSSNVVVRVGSPRTVPPSGPIVSDAYAPCQQSEKLISGGHHLFNDPNDPPAQGSAIFDTFTIQSGPSRSGAIPNDGETPHGWFVRVRNDSAQEANRNVIVRAYALCAS